MSTFEKRLDSFIFFHLGSDAAVRVDSDDSGIAVWIEHQRVHPFHFAISQEKAEELTKAPQALEDFMLDLLTRHRRRN